MSVIAKQAPLGVLSSRVAAAKASLTLERVFFIVVVAVALGLVIGPLAVLLWSSIRAGGTDIIGARYSVRNYIEAYADARNVEAMTNSLVFAGGTTFIGLVLASFMAWSLERTRLPLRGLLFTLLLVPLAIPGMISSISWILLLSPRIGFVNVLLRQALGVIGIHLASGPVDVYTMGGMIFVEGLRVVPTAFLIMSAAFRSMDPALEEAAFAGGGDLRRTLARITLPLVLPGVLVAGIYVFMGAVQSFEIPGMIGLPAGIYLFSTRIYWAANVLQPPDFGLANAFAVTFLVLSVGLLWLYRRATRQADRYVTVTGRGYRARRVDIGRWRTLVLGIIIAYLVVAVALPFLILFWASWLPFFQVPSLDAVRSMSGANYLKLWDYYGMRTAVRNTVVVMLSAATLTMLLSLASSWIVVRSRLRGRGVLDMLTFLPHTMPGVVIGLSLILLYLGPLRSIPIYDTPAILVVGMVTTYLAFGTRTTNAALLQVHGELEEAAHVSGSSPVRALGRIVLPLTLPAFVNGWIWVAVHSMRELSLPLMLYSDNTAVISSKLWFMWGDGAVGQAAALGVCLLLALTVVTLLGR